MSDEARIRAALGGALVLIVAAVFISHRWDEEAGLDPVYLTLALGVVALAFPATRKWLAKSNIKLPGVEISPQVEDAVEAAATLPDASEEGTETSGRHSLKSLDEDWRGDPGKALAELQETLSGRLDWIRREFHGGKRLSDLATVEKLKDEGLIRPDQARLLTTVNEISAPAVEKAFEAGGETKESMVRFLLEADRVVYSSRLIAEDRYVRNALVDRGFALMDIGGQPNGRWPDFYAFTSGNPKATPFRVVVRMALKKDSNLIPRIRDRLRKKLPETPLDPLAKSVIVIPEISRVEPEEDSEIPAKHRDEFLEWIAAQARN